jgi:pyroglutamyl-peptidase
MFVEKYSMRKFIFMVVVITILLSAFQEAVSVPSSEGAKELVLITGFEPWASVEVNPSALIASSLNGTVIQGSDIYGIVLPVDFDSALQRMHQLISEKQPDLIIAIGLAAGSSRIRIETIAFNVFYDPYETNLFSSLHLVNRTGSLLLCSTIDVKETVSLLHKENIDVEQSYNAGLYLCNALFYETMHRVKTHKLEIPVGFVHIPQIADYGNSEWQLPDLINATTSVIKANIP